MPRVIVCDVNETLLNIGALGPYFEETFGDRRVLQEWFQTVLLYSEVVTIAGRDRILQGMLTLPPHPDVRAGLQAMRDAGLRLVTLTNNPPASVQQQLAHADLVSFFDRSFSVDTVQRFKPAADTYRSVAEALHVPMDRLRLVASHAWDVLGALRAGCAAAFVARPGKVVFPLGPQPDIVGPDFSSVAKEIVAVELG